MTVQTSKMLPNSAPRTQPPRTSGLPLIGQLANFVRRPFDYLLEARAQYGDIFTLDLGIFRWLILSHPRHIEHTMVENVRNYGKSGALWESARMILGNGLAVSEGEHWKRQRRMIQPQFHRQRLAGMTEAMVSATDECLGDWETATITGQPLKLMPAFAAITMRIIARAIFGQSLNSLELDNLSKVMAYTLDHNSVAMLSAALPKWAPIPGTVRYRQQLQARDEIINKVIAQEHASGTPSNSMLGMLLQMVDSETGEGMTDQQLHDEVVTFFLAGYETTSLALTWTVELLLQHPEALSKLQSEIDNVLQGRTPTFADLGALNYTRMVIQESMRLRPPAWFVVRTAIADDQIDGYHIPAGTTVLNFTYGIHHHPEQWKQPKRFDPERFMPEEVERRHKWAWSPFGAGQHQCIGRDFSIMEGQIILALLLQRYKIERAGNVSAELQLGNTLRPKGDVAVKLVRRK